MKTSPQQDSVLEKKRKALIKTLKQSDFPLHYMASRATLNNAPPWESEEKLAQRIPQWVARKHTIKDGPEKLEVLYDVESPENPINGVVINTVGEVSAHVWEKLYTGRLRGRNNEIIPVAPILAGGTNKELRIYKLKEPPDKYQTTRVFSRYCGLSLENIEHIYDEPDPDKQREQKRKQLFQTLTDKAQQLYTQLDALPEVPNPWPHTANITVEFIDKDYYQDQLQQGETVNTISFNKEHWSFNPEEYMKSPEKWKAVVRMIDFGGQMMNMRELREKKKQEVATPQEEPNNK